MVSVISVFLRRFSNKSYFCRLLILVLPEKSHFQILSCFIPRFLLSLTFSLHLKCLGLISSMQFLPFSFFVRHVFETSRSYPFTPTHTRTLTRTGTRTQTHTQPHKNVRAQFIQAHTHTQTHKHTHTHLETTMFLNMFNLLFTLFCPVPNSHLNSSPCSS